MTTSLPPLGDILRELTQASYSPLTSIISKLKDPTSPVVQELVKAARGGHQKWEIRYVTTKSLSSNFTENEKKEFYQALEQLKITCLSIGYVTEQDITEQYAPSSRSNCFIFEFSW